MARTDKHTVIAAGEDEDEQGSIPDFDFLDMCYGFAIAASAGGQLYGLTMLTIGCFIGQKAIRRNPGARAWVNEQTRALLPDFTKRQQLEDGEAGSPASLPANATHNTGNTAPDLFGVLDGAPHTLVIGGTRGGKTTLMHELAQRRVRDGAEVVVGDPDAAPGVWPGCRVAGGGDRFDEIATLLAHVQGEVAQRRAARGAGQRHFPPLYLVLDEVQDIAREVEGANALIEDIARRGAKLNVHAILGVQDKLVGTLGWEGKSDLRRNFLLVEVRRDGATGERYARLDDHSGERARVLPIPPLPDPETLIVRRAAHAATQPPPAPPAATRPPIITPPLSASTAPTPSPTMSAVPSLHVSPVASTATTSEHIAATVSPPVSSVAHTPSSDPLLAQLLATVPPSRVLNAANDTNTANAQENALNDAAAHSSANVPPSNTAHSDRLNAGTTHSPLTPERSLTVAPERPLVAPAAPQATPDPPTAPSTAPSSVLLTLLGTLEQVGDADALQAMTIRLLALDPSDEELCRLIAALTLQADKGYGKQGALETAWGCTKGGGAIWQRASRLWDAIKLR